MNAPISHVRLLPDPLADPEILLQRLEMTRGVAILLRIQTADALRTAVERFNDAPITIAAVDELRETVLRIADGLAPQHSVRVPS